MYYPSFYVCYEGDVFASLSSSADVQSFLTVLTNQLSNLCFACEEAPGPLLPVLDVEIIIHNKEFCINVYLKPTVAGVFFHFSSMAGNQLCPGNEALSLVYCIMLFIFIK